MFASKSDETEWMLWARCASEGGPTMFPDPSDHRGEAEAKNECFACTVQDDCLLYALRHGEQLGIWGGKNPDERRAIRRRDNRAARLVAAEQPE